MKKKLTLFFLVFALILTCANAMAKANIDGASAEGGSGATIEKQSDGQSVKVTYAGEKDKEYVVMAVAESGVDATAGRPTKDTIGNNQDGVVVYMDQAKGNSNGNVEFTVRPNLDQAKKGDTYSIYISSNAANSSMAKVGSFTIDELIDEVIRYLGDLDKDEDITIDDVMNLLTAVLDKAKLEGDDFTVADVDKDGDITIDDVMSLLTMVLDKTAKAPIK